MWSVQVMRLMSLKAYGMLPYHRIGYDLTSWVNPRLMRDITRASPSNWRSTTPTESRATCLISTGWGPSFPRKRQLLSLRSEPQAHFRVKLTGVFVHCIMRIPPILSPFWHCFAARRTRLSCGRSRRYDLCQQGHGYRTHWLFDQLRNGGRRTVDREQIEKVWGGFHWGLSGLWRYAPAAVVLTLKSICLSHSFHKFHRGDVAIVRDPDIQMGSYFWCCK